jgi:predicted ester cyclase
MEQRIQRTQKTRAALASLAAGILMGLMILIPACSSPQPATPAKEQPGPPSTPKTQEEIAKWYQDCWNDFNEKKWDDFKKCYANNATSQQAGYGKLNVSGPDAIVSASQDFMKTFPDGRGEGQLILINGNHIASMYLLKGTNSGPLRSPDGKDIPGRNKKLGLMFGHAVEIDPAGPKVLKETGAMDGVTFENQLGFLKMPGRPLMETGVPMPKVVIAKNDETETKNLEADKAQLDAWNKRDAATVASYVADDALFHDMTATKDSNKAQSAQNDKQFWQAFSDAKITPSSMWAAGDYVAITGMFDGTNDGDFAPMKLKKTGKKVSLPFVEIDRLESGKLKESWLTFDAASFASQLGVQ